MGSGIDTVTMIKVMIKEYPVLGPVFFVFGVVGGLCLSVQSLVTTGITKLKNYFKRETAKQEIELRPQSRSRSETILLRSLEMNGSEDNKTKSTPSILMSRDNE